MTREIKKSIYWVGAIDFDRKLFDELIPLPDGTSYNSYIVKGSEKTALIDSVDPVKEQELIDNLKTLKIEQIDYVIAHHGEQDHSGVIPRILKEFPMAKIVTNSKCKEMLKDLLLIPDDKFITVNDRETISFNETTNAHEWTQLNSKIKYQISKIQTVKCKNMNCNHQISTRFSQDSYLLLVLIA